MYILFFSGYNTIENSHSTQVLEELSSKEINLKDVMDIALTTLSFLSFGMFVLQILTFVTNVRSKIHSISRFNIILFYKGKP